MLFRYVVLCVLVLVGPTVGQALAGPQSLLGNEGAARAAFLDFEQRGTALAVPAHSVSPSSGASLFAGKEAGLFSRLERPGVVLEPMQGSGVQALRYLIAKAEAGSAQYDAVQYGARIKPGKRPTDMTIGEIYRWIEATPGQPHAIGRYQFIPPTLRRLVTILGLPENTRFSPLVQDRLADILFEDAGLSSYLAGEMYQTEFMNNLAKIWAGLPNSSGRSHYHGYAGNKATMSWTYFQARMDEIFPRG